MTVRGHPTCTLRARGIVETVSETDEGTFMHRALDLWTQAPLMSHTATGRRAPGAAAWRASVIATFIVASVLDGGCALLRATTNPPDFKQIAQKDIHGAMHVMAAQVQMLDAALRDEALPEEERQRQVLAALDVIAAQARGLHPPGAVISHAMLHDKLPQFIRDVEGARAAAAADPPRYFLAGSVSGTCMSCHRPG